MPAAGSRHVTSEALPATGRRATPSPNTILPGNPLPLSGDTVLSRILVKKTQGASKGQYRTGSTWCWRPGYSSTAAHPNRSRIRRGPFDQQTTMLDVVEVDTLGVKNRLEVGGRYLFHRWRSAVRRPPRNSLLANSLVGRWRGVEEWSPKAVRSKLWQPKHDVTDRSRRVTNSTRPDRRQTRRHGDALSPLPQLTPPSASSACRHTMHNSARALRPPRGRGCPCRGARSGCRAGARAVRPCPCRAWLPASPPVRR